MKKFTLNISFPLCGYSHTIELESENIELLSDDRQPTDYFENIIKTAEGQEINLRRGTVNIVKEEELDE